MPSSWIGVDVGGARKGFDAAVIDDQRLIGLHDHLDVVGVLDVVTRYEPAVIAIDSPRCFAPDGKSARDGERQLRREICGIRWTPDEARAVGDYYAWVHEGLRLYQALEARAWREVIEVFPTASWTRWLGARGKRRRAAWTTDGLAALPIDELPRRSNQDQRDAIAAALTARQHTEGATEELGELVVPKAPASTTRGDVEVPRVPVSAGALIYDTQGRLLILRPTYKRGWTVPGGQLEENGETPWEGCGREVHEETGLRVEGSRLACVDFKRPRPGKPGGLRLLFDCGELSDDKLDALILDEDEIAEHRFLHLASALELLSGPVSRRVRAATHSETCVYLEEGQLVAQVG